MLQGKTEDEIYMEEKSKNENLKCLPPPKLTGYVAPMEYEQRKLATTSFRQNSSNSSFSFSQRSLLTQENSQSTEFLNNFSQNSSSQSSSVSQNNIDLSTLCTQPINVNSATKKNISNIGGGDQNSVLRENVDSDQRQKSAQKYLSFSGKDQKNVSPYSDKVRNSLNKHSNSKSSLMVGGRQANIMKAKRQISFDA